MRILIASGIFEPESGGPATYAPALASRLCARGYDVAALTYSDKPSFPTDRGYPFKITRVVRHGKILSRIAYFIAALRLVRRADLVYTLDWFAAGFLIAIAARLYRVPYIVRVGGDYLWEQRYIESGQEPCSLAEFYARGLHRRFSYRIPFLIISFVLARATVVVFNSHKQRELYERYYRLSPTRTATIKNPVPVFERIVRAIPTDEFVYWGRLIHVKNVDTLIRAFAKAHIPEHFTLTIIGNGPQKAYLEALVYDLHIFHRVRFEPGTLQMHALERVKDARAFILPSWTDISPNQVTEAISLGIPALVTKENYLSIDLPETFDPHSEEELTRKIEMLADDAQYAQFVHRFKKLSVSHDWNAVVAEHLKIFERALGYAPIPFRVLQIGADRSRRGILYPDSPAAARQRAYAEGLGQLDIIGFSRSSDGTHAYREPHLSVYPTNSRSSLLYGWDALRTARKVPRPSVISVQDPFETGIVGCILAKRFGAPLHVQVHTDFLSPHYAEGLRNRIRRAIAGYVLRRASRIRVVSNHIAHAITQRYALHVPITVLPIFVDLDRLRNPESDPQLTTRFAQFEKKLLVVARLEEEKNVALTIRAFAESAPQSACLVVVGEGSARKRLEALARTLSISDRVFFEGTQNSSRYYPLADLVLVPSKYEGYGLVIVEALAAGKPVLATDVGIAREAGAIVSSEKDFAKDLKQWFENGLRTGHLAGYPYANFDEYVAAYCDDVRASR
ncbi:MAG TPA: glycosyltransferase [Candidatus Paceibacterota bacterium]|nr:glycosyltransferase [Candidatus Paceibacterota bacterium]